MTAAPFFHGTFTLKRVWAAPSHRVFGAWCDPEPKAQWFTGPPERWTLLRRSMDFRVGGQEVLEGRFLESGTVTLFEARFHVIEPARRLVYTYDLHHSGRFHSVTLSSSGTRSGRRRNSRLLHRADRFPGREGRHC